MPNTDRTILLTGFEAFADFPDNPSGLVAVKLDGSTIGGHPLKGVVLPVVFGESGNRLEALIRDVDPVAVICLGLAADRTAITPERIAINIDDARVADNAGQQPRGQSIVADAPAAYWSSLPIAAMVQTLQQLHIPTTASSHAGTYVCNHVFYRLMHSLHARPDIPAGFIHLPGTAEADESRGDVLTLERLTRAIEALILTVLTELRKEARPEK